MVDTVRTQSAILTTLFQDGQTALSISPQDMRDFVVSSGNLLSTSTGSTIARTAASRFADIVNVKDFGAIGSGSSNVASSVYGSLAALQAVYGVTISGVTVALTQELDWLATQAAINRAAVVGGGNGGVVYSPSGTYVYSNANSVSDGSGTLYFPGTGPYASNGAVSWLGDFLGTIHTWPSDLGTGKFAVLCANRATGSSVGFFEGHKFIGPGNGTTYGTSGCNMQGIATNDARNMRRISSSAFRVGINVVGGQFLWEDVRTGSDGRNYYGIYFDTPNANNWGNMQFVRLVCDNNNKAAVGVGHAACIIASHFLSSFFGTAPYAIFKETNSGVPGNVIVVYQSKFDLCQFEGIGNAMVSDDTATQAARVVVIQETDFVKCQFLWNSAYKIAAVGAYSILDVNALVGVQILDPIGVDQWVPGSVNMFNANSYAYMFRIKGDITALIANAGATGFSNNLAAAGNTGTTFECTQNGNWTGQSYYANDSSVIGSVLNYLQQATAGTTTDTVWGVSVYLPTPGAGQSGIAIQSGYATVKVSGAVTAGKWLRTSSGGLAVAASASNDTTSPMIGIAMSAASGGTCTVKLQGLV